MNGKFSDNFITPEIRKTSDLPFHNDLAPGKRRVFLEKTLLADSDVYIMVRTAKNVTEDQPQYVESHAHRVSSTYIFIGSEDNLEGLQAEVVLDGEVHTIESPATVFIPPGVQHSYRLMEGSGHFIHTVLEGNYDASLLYQPGEAPRGLECEKEVGI